MNTYLFKKQTNGFTISMNGNVKAFNQANVSIVERSISFDIYVSNNLATNYTINPSIDSITVNDVVYSGSIPDLSILLINTVFNFGGNGITLPIEISDVTGLPSALDEKSNIADELKGSITFALDGIQKVFNIPHPFGIIPTSMQVTFEDAANLNFVQSTRTRDASNVIFTCNDAPAIGSETVYYTISK